MTQTFLHPGAKWIFRFRASFTLIILLIFVYVFLLMSMSYHVDFLVLILVLMIFLLLGIFFVEIYARMSYDRWKYEFTQTNLKIERGIIWKRYSNVPYERVQNVDISRGVFARIFGFSSVFIQTAGYSAPAGYGTSAWAEGYIPAVSSDEAEKIREFLMQKISDKSAKQGL